MRLTSIALWMALCACFVWPSGAQASKRLAVLVDNSGSMHGRCRDCVNVAPEVVTALHAVIELMEAHNRKNPSDPVEIVLMLFGGWHGTTREFREIPLTADLDLSATLNAEYYQDTDFNLAFEEGAKALEGRAATHTVFLSDASAGGLPGPDTPSGMSRFGAMNLYGLTSEIAALDAWRDAFTGQGITAKSEALRVGWEIIPSFAEVFLGFLVTSSERYLVFRRRERLVNEAVELTKVSSGAATVYIIAHQDERLVFEHLVGDDGTMVEMAGFTVEAGTHLITAELPATAPAGNYRLVFGASSQVPEVTTIMLESAELMVVDHLHPVNHIVQHKRNEPIFVDLRFTADFNGRAGNELGIPQQAAMFEIARVEATLFDEEGVAVWSRVPTDPPKKNIGTLAPGRYTLSSSWSYELSGAAPKQTIEAGVISVAETSGIVLEVTVRAKDTTRRLDEPSQLWQWREAQVTARFLEASGIAIPKEISSSETVTLALQGGGAVTLTREGEHYTGTLGNNLPPGLHSLTLHSPDPAAWGIVVDGGEFTVVPRDQRVKVEVTYTNADPEAEGTWGSFLRGLSHVIGTDRQASTTVESELVGPYPVHQPIWLQYYDDDEQTISLTLVVDPLFDDEELDLSVEYEGQDEYDAAEAYVPGLFGLGRGAPRRISGALKVGVDPASGPLKVDEPIMVLLSKDRCDWDIQRSLQPRPEIRIFGSIYGRGVLEPVAVLLDIRTREHDKMIISAVRGSVLVVLSVVTLTAFAFVCLLMLWRRRRHVRRAELWRKILALEPADFVEVLPPRARELLERWSHEQQARGPADYFRFMIDDGNRHRRELAQLRDMFSTRELMKLAHECGVPRLTGSWTIQGPSATLHGWGLTGGASGIRFRDPSLPEDMGRLQLEGTEGERTISFAASTAVAIKHGEDDLPPPHTESISLGRKGTLLAGGAVGSYRVRLDVSLRDDLVVVQTSEI